MSRRLRVVFSLLLLSFALSAAACAADSTGPQPNAAVCDQNSQNTC